jgi:lipopolysaccharide/colanic/teichoic acid biosynthesis glycosyltransferase
LLNVLVGEMSLVGPRPEHLEYVQHYTPEHKRVLSVRPGITSPAAIAFVDEQLLLDGPDAETSYVNTVLPQKLALDLEYVEHSSFGGDLRILGRTAALVLRRLF